MPVATAEFFDTSIGAAPDANIVTPAAGDILVYSGGKWTNFTANIQQSQPSDPTGTTSLVGVMMGLGISFTPKFTGKVKIHVNAWTANDTIADGSFWNIRFGTGTAPINGAAATGTISGRSATISSVVAANNIFTLTVNGYSSGLIVNTAYWFDIVLGSNIGGTSTLKFINYIIEEVW